MTISFRDVADISGISYKGESYGAYWGDFNQDNFPDLWVTNHLELASLYQNQGDGTFTNVGSEIFEELPNEDIHGAAWADFDNDGDVDLIQQRASDFGNGVNQFYVNEQGILVNKASNLEIDLPNRGAYPLWFDFDGDGLLDLNLNGGKRIEAPPGIFRQTESGVFENVNTLTGFDINATLFSVISDISRDGIPELIVDGKTIYDTSSLPFKNVTDTLGGNSISERIVSATTADFNGDLLPDLYVTRKGDQSDIFQDSPNSFNAFLKGASDEKGAKFTTEGDVTFELATKAAFVSIKDIKIGANGFSPNDFKFTLSPNDPNVRGIPPHEPGVDLGVFVGFDPNLKEWQILWSRPDRRQTYVFVEAEESISQLSAVGFDLNSQFLADQLLMNTTSGFVDSSQEAGIDIPTAGQSVVAADFDNDMDVDIYVVASGFAANRTNILYENQGDGRFLVLSGAGGAGGTTLGLGDSVTVADYDVDGFQDIFVTNGNFFAGLGRVSRTFYNDAPYQLFRNQGNDNHWLEVDLQGVLSNRDGIGTQVFATANGVTQLREQNGGLHKSQSHQRIHFGLADNNVVDVLEIRWLNGVVQKLGNIAADRIIEVVEGIGFEGNDFIKGSNSGDRLVGNEGNDFLDGGFGDDVLIGGTGSDRFFFGLNNGNDTVEDFVVGEDVIEITANSHFNQENEILTSIISSNENSNSSFSELTLSPGNTIKIAHDRNLTVNSFSIVTEIEMFRFRNIHYELGTDLFVNEVEKEAILNNPALNQTFKLENNGNPTFVASLLEGDNLLPFYRLRSLNVSGTYLFVSTEEHAMIFAEDSSEKDRWVKEGLSPEGEDVPEFYLYGGSAKQGMEFNRFLNAQNGTFLYADRRETEQITSNPNLSDLLIDQGIAFKSL